MIFSLLAGCVVGQQGQSDGTTPAETDTPDDTDLPDDTDEPVAIGDLDPTTLPAGASPCREPVLVDIQEVTDGDTVEIRGVESFEWESVRLIGYDAPEIAHGRGSADCWGNEAWDAAEQQLSGQQAWLTFDTDCIDLYDRTLAYVHLGADAFFNVEMVREGNGTIFTISPNDTFEELFREAEAEARQGALGLWGPCL